MNPIEPTPQDRALADRICAMIAEHIHWACVEAVRQCVDEYEERLGKADEAYNGLCEAYMGEKPLGDIQREYAAELDRLNLEIARLAEEERTAAEMPAYISPSPKWEEDPWLYEGSWCGRYTRVAQSEANGEPEQIVDVYEVKAPREGLHPEMIDGMWRWVEDEST